MNRDEQEMALWAAEYAASKSTFAADRAAAADLAAAFFAHRYPPQLSAPPAVWYDEPPRPGEYHVEGLSSVCWIEEDTVWCPSWDRSFDIAVIREMPRNGRRVCPITKPPEPTT